MIEAVALLVTLCAFASMAVGVFCLLYYGLFAGDDHPTGWDRLQASLLGAAALLFVVLILVMVAAL